MNTNQLPRRFWAKVAAGEHGCWVWVAARDTAGYGQYFHNGVVHRAHRVAYQSLVELIPPWTSTGPQLDHLCRNRACVNPRHLELVTAGENVRRGESPAAFNAIKTHCPAGHPLIDGNFIPALLKRGSRVCLTCARESDRERAQLIRRACAATGLTWREYTARHGYSADSARHVIKEHTP